MNASWRRYDIRLLAVLASLLISAYTIALPELPNDDAYTYVRTAEVFLQDGISAAFDHYAWASYSLLIAGVSQLGVSLFMAAYLLNAVFFALITWSFISIVKELDDSAGVLFIAALTILTFPELNEYRYLVIRDTGFWALSLFALYQLLRFARTVGIAHGLYFCLALLAASLLRPEAVLYLLLAPCALLFDDNARYSRGDVFRLWGMGAAGLLLYLLMLFLSGVNAVELLSSFTRGYQTIIANNFSPGPEQTNALVNALFGQHGAQYSSDMLVLFMTAGLLALLVGELISGIGLPVSILLIWGWVWRHIRFERNANLPLLGFAAVNLGIAIVFVFATHYLASRYVMLLCLVLVSLVPGIVSSILRNAANPQQARAWIIFFFLFATVDAYVTFGRSQQYLEDAAEFVRRNSNESINLLTNNRTVAFLSDKVEDYDRVDRILQPDQIAALRQGDLLAVESFYDMDEIMKSPELIGILGLEVEFSEGEDVRIRVYRKLN